MKTLSNFINEKLVIGKGSRMHKHIKMFNTNKEEFFIPIAKFYVFYDDYHDKFKIDTFLNMCGNVWYYDEENFNTDNIVFVSDDLAECAQWVILNKRNGKNNQEILDFIKQYDWDPASFEKFPNDWYEPSNDFQDAFKKEFNIDWYDWTQGLGYDNDGWLVAAAADALPDEDRPGNANDSDSARYCLSETDTWEKFKTLMEKSFDWYYKDILDNR